jgi:hypothetical protein
MNTVAELTEKYLEKQFSNKEFCQNLNTLYLNQFNKKQINIIYEYLVKLFNGRKGSQREKEGYKELLDALHKINGF